MVRRPLLLILFVCPQGIPGVCRTAYYHLDLDSQSLRLTLRRRAVVWRFHTPCVHTSVCACVRTCAPTVSFAPDSFCVPLGHPGSRPNRLSPHEFSFTELATDVAPKTAISVIFRLTTARSKTRQTESPHSPNRPDDLVRGLAHFLYIPGRVRE